MDQPLRNLGRYASVLAGVAIVTGGVGIVPSPFSGVLLVIAGLAAGTALISYPIYWAAQAITQTIAGASAPKSATDHRAQTGSP